VTAVARWRRECLERGDDLGLEPRDRLQHVRKAGKPSVLESTAFVLEHVEKTR
jgi:hypothetical protein